MFNFLDICIELVLFFLKCLVEFLGPVKPFSPEVVFVERFLTTNSKSLIDREIFRLSLGS